MLTTCKFRKVALGKNLQITQGPEPGRVDHISNPLNKYFGLSYDTQHTDPTLT